MASIASCPRCTSNLKIPVGAFAESRARCPVCGAEFQVSEAPVQALPEALVLPPAPRRLEEPEKVAPAAADLREAQGAAVAATENGASVGESSRKLESLREQLAKPSLSSLLQQRESAELESLEVDATGLSDEELVETAGYEEEERAEREEEAELRNGKPVEAEFEQAESEQAETVQAESVQSEAAQSEATPSQTLEELLSIWRSEPEAPKKPEPPQKQETTHELHKWLADGTKAKSQAEEVEEVSPAGTAARTTSAADLLRSPFQKSEPAEMFDEEPAPVEESRGEESRGEELHIEESPTEVATESEFDQSLSETIYSLDKSPSTTDQWDAEQSAEDELDLGVEGRPAFRGRVKRFAGKAGAVAAMGLACAYGLLWVGGPSLDVLQLSKWAPEAILPSSLQAEPALAASASGDESPAAAPLAESPLTESSPEAAATQTAAAEPATVDSDQEFLKSGAVALLTDRSSARTSASAPNVRVDSAVSPASAVSSVESVGPIKNMIELLENPQHVSSAQLTAALTAAEQAAPELIGGDLTERDSIGRKGQAYMAMAKLAEHAALVDAKDSAFNHVIQRAEALKLFQQVIAEESNQSDLAQIAARWSEYAQRPSPGILFEGTVKDVRAAGRLTEYLVELKWATGSVIVPVLMPRMEFSTGDRVGIAGLVVADPRTHVREYEGNSPQVVLADMSFDLAAVGKRAGY